MLVFFWSVFTTADKLAGQVCHAFWFWAFDFDFCTPVGSGSLELRLYWICTSKEDKWLIFWDSVKSNLLTRRENGKGNWKKMSPVVPTPKSTHMLYCHRKPTSQSRHVLPYLSLLAVELSLQPALWWQKLLCGRSLVQGPHTLRLMPVRSCVLLFSSPALGSLSNWNLTNNHVSSGLLVAN